MLKRSFLFLMIFIPLANLWGQDNEKIVATNKPSLALVTIDRKPVGTAVCIHPSGIFVLSERIIRPDVTFDPIADGILLTTNPDSKDFKDRKGGLAKILKIDKNLGLVVVQVADNKLTPVTFGDDTGIKKGSALTGLGFTTDGPRDPALLVSKKATVEAALMNFKKQTSLYQLSEKLPERMAGGGLFDENGKLVAFLKGDKIDSFVNDAIPVSYFKKVFEKPIVSFDPPKITALNRTTAQEFLVYTHSLFEDDKDLSVELVLKTAMGTRTVKMVGKDGMHYAKVVPFSKEGAASVVNLEVQYPDGFVKGVATDASFQLGGEPLKLSDIKTLEINQKNVAVLGNGKTEQGGLRGLDSLQITLHGKPFKFEIVEGMKITNVGFQGSNKIISEVVVKKAGTEIDRQVKALGVTDVDPLKALADGKFTPPEPTEKGLKTYLKMGSAKGDFIGQGQNYNFTDLQATFNPKTNLVVIQTNGFYISFAPPKDEEWKIQEYTETTAYNQKGKGFIGAQGPGRASSASYGKFVIYEVEIKDEKVVRFAAEFISHADKLENPPIYGIVRFNSKYE